LEDNYRSTPEILSVADFLIQHNEYRKSKHLLPSRESGSSVRLSVYATARDEAEDIAEQILASVEQGGAFSDFAVLYRTNAQSRLFEHALTRRQIPFQLIGGFRFYLRKEIKDLVSYLLLINNPDDSVALQRAINSPARGVGKQTMSKIQRYAESNGLGLLAACRACVEQGIISTRSASGVRKFLKIYDQLCSLATGPLLDLLECTIELTGYREYLAKRKSAQAEDSDIAANLDELLAEASELDRHHEQSGLESESSPLERFLEFAALQSDADRLEQGRDVVTLMTLHAAKGLEFPSVYIAAVEENVLPHARSKDDPMALEEERRLLFVGITRAEDQLQLSYAKRRGFSSHGSGVPSSFLMELPRSEMQWIDRTEVWGESEYGDEFSWRGHAAKRLRAAGDGLQDEWDQQQDQLGDWDEACQISPCDTESDGRVGQLDLDDCQLPPEEMLARFGARNGSRQSNGSGYRRLSSLSVDDEDAFGEQEFAGADFCLGCTVRHQEFGLGELISTQGHGLKRSVTIQFANDGRRRTFRLSHVRLDVVQNSG
jgi:DNA helicase-2/ATP-dependent DNA helicase PcrA